MIRGEMALIHSLGTLKILSSKHNEYSAICFNANIGSSNLKTLFSTSLSSSSLLRISRLPSEIVACAMKIRMKLIYYNLMISPLLLASLSIYPI